jgi:hypothetical protein
MKESQKLTTGMNRAHNIPLLVCIYTSVWQVSTHCPGNGPDVFQQRKLKVVKIGEARWKSHRNAQSQEEGGGCRRRYPSGGFLMHPSRQDGSLIPQALIATNREVCGGEQAERSCRALPKDFYHIG